MNYTYVSLTFTADVLMPPSLAMMTPDIAIIGMISYKYGLTPSGALPKHRQHPEPVAPTCACREHVYDPRHTYPVPGGWGYSASHRAGVCGGVGETSQTLTLP